jgi:hypothetical protein
MAIFSKRQYIALAEFCRRERLAARANNLSTQYMSNSAILRLAQLLRDDNAAFDLNQFMNAAQRGDQ